MMNVSDYKMNNLFSSMRECACINVLISEMTQFKDPLVLVTKIINAGKHA